jgi:hypothetical protein
MGRARRPYNGSETVAYTGQGRDRFWQSEMDVPVGTRQRIRWKNARNWAYRANNGVYDPLTYLQVLDTVLSIDPQIELRSKVLAKFLNDNKIMFYWDAITVGRILTDLAESFEEVMGKKMGLLERGTDYRGNFFLLHVNADTIKVANDLREDLMRLSTIEMAVRDRGETSKRYATPLLECPSMRGEFNEADAV